MTSVTAKPRSHSKLRRREQRSVTQAGGGPQGPGEAQPAGKLGSMQN